MNKPLIELKNINMVFQKKRSLIGSEKSFHVLKNIDLSINEGEILAIVGESGCGKTTLGKIITGLLSPTTGEIFYKGENVNKIFSSTAKEYHSDIQFVQQDSYAALNPVRTIYQSLLASLNVKHKSLSKKEKYEKISELLATVGLVPSEQFIDKFPHQLSGGQRQRVLMARALSLDPKVILCDEPVSMIDVSLRISILNLMLSLNKEKKITFIYITHDLATAKYIANNGKMAVMYLGEIVEYGLLNHILSKPKHPYTQALFAAVPIPDPKISRIQKEIPIKSMEQISLQNRGEGCPFAIRCPYDKEDCKQKINPYIDENNTLVRCIRKEKFNEN